MTETSSTDIVVDPPLARQAAARCSQEAAFGEKAASSASYHIPPPLMLTEQ